MDLRQLEILKAVAETGSFTGAGRRLHVSQSAISRQILLLEAELNEPLFWRIKRKVKITPAGEALLQLSLRVFDDIRETTERLSETQQKLTGTIRLVGGMTVSIYVFPTLLKEFQRLHPDVDVKVMTGPADRLVRRLRAGTVDLGLLTLPVSEPDLVTRPVMREELQLVTYPGHPMAQKKRVETQDLNKLPFILYESGSNTRRVIDEFFVREQVQPRIVMETENVEIIKAMVASGIGSTLISNHAIEREVKAGMLVAHRLQAQPLVRETGWVYLKANRVPRKISEMIRVLDELLPKMGLTQSGRDSSVLRVLSLVNYDAIVLGAGAAGLFCAAIAGQRGRQRSRLERNREPGRKILISGGGRCNFTNVHCRPEHFLSAIRHSRRSALARYQPSDFIALVERYGIRYHEKTLGQLFCDGSSQRDSRSAARRMPPGRRRGDRRLRCHRRCARASSSRRRAGTFEAPALVVATGGLSIPKIGATDFGYRHRAAVRRPDRDPPRPALVPLLFDDATIARAGRDLAGIATDCAVSVPIGTVPTFRERLLFTHRGSAGRQFCRRRRTGSRGRQ